MYYIILVSAKNAEGMYVIMTVFIKKKLSENYSIIKNVAILGTY